jgi:hypothetical protein
MPLLPLLVPANYAAPPDALPVRSVASLCERCKDHLCKCHLQMPNDIAGGTQTLQLPDEPSTRRVAEHKAAAA